MLPLDKELYHKKAGVYIISNSLDSRVYIGSSRNLYNRSRHHKDNLPLNKHKNIHLQRFYNKYGDILKIEVLEVIENYTVELLTEREQYWIDFYQAKTKLFNIRKKAYLKEKYPISELALKVLRERIKKSMEDGTNHSSTPEFKEKMSKLMKGNTYSLGYKMTPEQLEKTKNAKIKTGAIKQVDQLTLDGEYIQTFDSARQAGFYFGKKHQGIDICFRKPDRTAYGYKWRYTNEQYRIENEQLLRKKRGRQ